MSIVSTEASSVPTEPGPRWQASLRDAIRCPRQLLQRVGLAGHLDVDDAAAFPVFVTQEYVSRIQPGDPDDPLLRQVLPLSEERVAAAGFSEDPLEEQSRQRHPGLIQKYQGRALMVLTGACGIHCRYCFRRSYPYAESRVDAKHWDAAIACLAADQQIHEVILSGGDPLTLVDETLGALTQQVAALPHVRAIRVHSRMPIVIPHRIEAATLDWMTQTNYPLTLVLHANHPQELDEEVAQAIQRLRDAGILLLNQAVLLAGVNDQLATLKQLSWRLLEIGVLPYYLHQCDRIQGAAHFEVPISRGLSLVSQLRASLPGYAVPRYVVEEPGQPNKTILL